MNFQEAETRYLDLQKKFAAGEINAQAYEANLSSLRVIDTAGETWMLQAHTGRWFVYRNNQWVDGQRMIHAPAQWNQPGMAVAVPRAAHTTRPAQKKKWGYILLIAGILGVCLLCGLAGTAGAYLVATGKIQLPGQIFGSGMQPTPGEGAGNLSGEQDDTQVEVKPVEVVAVPTDGAPHADKNGVTLTVPAEAVEENLPVNLTSVELNAPWREAVDEAVTIQSPFYRLSTQGKNDTPGTLTLSFPAAEPASRILAVVDDEYLVELTQAPQDGKITLQTRAGPSDTSEIQPPGGYDGTGTIYYAVITPKVGKVPVPEQGAQMVSLSTSMEVDERNCIPDISIIGGAAINLCRQNPSGTLQVMLPTTQRALLPQVDLMVDKIEAVMQKYYDLGFTTAQLTKSSPMLVRVSTKVSSPSYYPLNGVLYIPADSVSKIASLSPTDVYHEMAHWIQAVKYSTRIAYYSGEKTWWLETAAENMVMLVEPAYVGGNLTTYGTISNSDNTLAMQSSPYQWPGDYYVQAQFVKINLCDDPSCPLSPPSFAKAVSEGAYPLMDGAMKAKMSANLKEYAYYLLGKTPVSANSSIPLTGPVKSGEGYGEYVRITRTANTDLKYDYNGMSPQMRKETVNGLEALVIEARLQEDGVYPLSVLGGQGSNPGLPVEMIIDPGAPFYYTLDDGEWKYANGGSEVKITPIHGVAGIKKVRLVAVGENGGEVLKARVQPVNLNGAWVVHIAGEKTAGVVECSGSGEVDNPDATAQLMAMVMMMAGATGDMTADPTGRNLDWAIIESRVPAEFAESKITHQATALLTGEGIKYQAQTVIPDPKEGSNIPPAIPAAALAAVPLVWFGRRSLRPQTARILTNLVVLIVLVFVSTGCFGLGMWGTATTEAVFNKLEYVGGKDTGQVVFNNETGGIPSGSPIWKLSGSATYDVTFYIETTVTGQDGKDTTELETCTGQVTYPVIGLIYKDVTITIPKD